jgi:hypothetical protein
MSGLAMLFSRCGFNDAYLTLISASVIGIGYIVASGFDGDFDCDFVGDDLDLTDGTVSFRKSVSISIPGCTCSLDRSSQRVHVLCPSSEKNLTARGHPSNELVLNRRCSSAIFLAMLEGVLFKGLLWI